MPGDKMQFDPENKVVKLCALGMSKEAEGKMEEAATIFHQAWHEASNDLEKFTAAHYVARHQGSVAEKLKWDTVALDLALKLNDTNLMASYPSLYLNVAKCYEDLEDAQSARSHYELALSFAHLLPADGYGKMIRSGIDSGLARTGGKDK